jgi:gluconolactonase
MDAKGGIYFTDPGPRPVVPGRTMHVFYLPAGAKAPIVIDARNPRPNGLVHSNTLIVDDTLGVIVWPFDIEPDGTGTNKRVFATLRGIPTDHESGADGMAIDSDDRVYVTTAAGSSSSTQKGSFSGMIKAERQAANAAFAGPDKQTLISRPAKVYIA